MATTAQTDPRFPVGKFNRPTTALTPAQRAAYIEVLVKAPEEMRAAIRGLNDAQLDVQRCRARDHCSFGEPCEHAMRNPASLVRGAHGEQHEVPTLLAERHDGEARHAGAVARHDRRRVAVGDHRNDALAPVFPSQPDLDEVVVKDWPFAHVCLEL